GSVVVAIFGPFARVEPALSSMQLAFARAGIPWDQAGLASLHGRNLRATLLPLLGRMVIGLFTQDGNSPGAVARFCLARGLDNYQAIVGENLGGPDERVTRWQNLHELAQQSFTPLNFLILLWAFSPREKRFDFDRRRALVPGAPDDNFASPEGAPEVM